MADKTDSVFISYRRKTSKHPALLVFKDLDSHGYDAFIDYESIDSGIFATEILNQIASRRHFVIILSPECLDRTINPDDWLRREIEYAIDMQRNIVPLLFDDFKFESAKQYLVGKLSVLGDYNGLTVPDGYFDEAMDKLRTRFLKQPVKGTVKAVTTSDNVFAREALQKAYNAVDGEDIRKASRIYLGGNALPKQTIIPDVGKKKPPKQPSADVKPKSSVSELSSILGRQPFRGEVIHLNKDVNIDVSLLAAQAGRLILTNMRLIFIDLEDDSHSFEIPMSKLRATKFTYFNLLDVNRFTIRTNDGTKYHLVVSENLRSEIEEKVRKLLKQYQSHDAILPPG